MSQNSKYLYMISLACILRACRVLFAILLVIAVSMQCGEALADTTVRVGAYENPPKIHTEPDGKVIGIFPEILAHIAELEGWKIEYVHGTWQECLDRLETGQLDLMVDVAYSEERAQHFGFCEETVFVNWAVLCVPDGSEIESYQDLCDRTVAVMRGSIHTVGKSSIGNILRGFDIGCNFVEVDDYQAVLELLQSGKADAGVVNRLFADLHAKKYGVEKTHMIFDPRQLRFAYSMSSETGRMAADKIDERLLLLKAGQDTVYHRTLRHHLASSQEGLGGESFNYSLLWKIICCAVLLIVLVVGLFVLWNRSLSAQVKKRTRDLNERVKELACLYGVSSLVAEPGRSIEEVLEKSVALIPPGWQYPEIICARIAYGDREFVSPGFRDTQWKLSADIVISGETVGVVEVCYLEKKPVFDDGPFLKEEKDLVIDLARQLGVMIRHKKAEAALQESENRFRTIFSRASDGILIADEERKKFVLANNTVCRMLGYTNEELLGMGVDDIHPAESIALVSEAFQKQLRREIDIAADLPVRRKDGSVFYADISSGPITLGGKTYMIGIFRDITERKKKEEAQRKLEAERLVVEELRRLDGMKDEFVSIITHELRTPMTPLKSSIEMFLDGSLGEINEQQKQYLDMMARNIDRLSQFTTEVLSLSRLQAGRYAVNPAMISIAKIADSAVEILKDKAQGKNSTIRLDIEDGLQAYADANALAQVLTNLVNNAIVHGGSGIEIKVVARKLSDKAVEISVSDNGQGIPEESIPHLFDRFYQADRKKAPGYQGTGIGLSLCEGLVKAMSGEISVESKEGEGTTFKFTLPASSAETKEK